MVLHELQGYLDRHRAWTAEAHLRDTLHFLSIQCLGAEQTLIGSSVQVGPTSELCPCLLYIRSIKLENMDGTVLGISITFAISRWCVLDVGLSCWQKI